jgi:sialic acid synthase SpsE
MKKKYIQCGSKKIGEGFPTFIVAEVANAHNGNFETALKMIDKIKDKKKSKCL